MVVDILVFYNLPSLLPIKISFVPIAEKPVPPRSVDSMPDVISSVEIEARFTVIRPRDSDTDVTN